MYTSPQSKQTESHTLSHFENEQPFSLFISSTTLLSSLWPQQSFLPVLPFVFLFAVSWPILLSVNSIVFFFLQQQQLQHWPLPTTTTARGAAEPREIHLTCRRDGQEANGDTTGGTTEAERRSRHCEVTR